MTNLHNVTGRHWKTGKKMHPRPNYVRIMHHGKLPPPLVGRFVEREEPLEDRVSGRSLWSTHPTLGDGADIAALPLTQLDDDVTLHFCSDGIGEPNFVVTPTSPVSVIGFPFGYSAAGFPIWATGFVASEPDLDFDRLPVFLIDCRGRDGQSGAPVITHYAHGLWVPLEDGRPARFDGPVWRFLGMYSGRINKKSDLGMVWKASAVQELVAAT